MSSLLSKNLGTFLIYVGCAVLLFAAKISQGYVLAPEDNFVQNFPAFAGSGFLWTPLLLCGFPVLADPQVQFFYPLAWLARLLPLGSGLTTNFSIYVISAYVLSAFFMAALARRLTGSWYGGLMAGLTYAFSGYLISELKHVQVLHTAVWFPLCMYFVQSLSDSLCGTAETGDSTEGDALAPLKTFVLSLLVALTIFAGHPQTALYVFSFVLAFALLRACKCRRPWIFLALIAFAFASGIALAAVQILPSMELSSFSVRPDFTFEDFIVGQIEPIQIVGFLFPYLLGGAYGTIGDLPYSEQGPPPGLMFFGFAPLILAGIAIFAAVKKWRNEKSLIDEKTNLDPALICFCAITTALALVLALGEHTPLARLFYFVPVWGSFRGLYRVTILCAFAVALLSAYGLAHVERLFCGEQSESKQLHFSKLGPVKHLFVCIYVLCSCFSYPFLLGTLPLLLFFFNTPKFSFLNRQNSSARQKILVSASFAALASYGLNAEWTKASPLASDFAPPDLAVKYGALTSESNTRIMTMKGLQGERDQLPPNLSRLWKVASATGYEPLVSKRYSRLLGIAEGGFVQPPWHISAAGRAFDVTSVRYLFMPWGKYSERAFEPGAANKWKLAQAADKTLIYENARALPRFYIVRSSLTLPAEKILTAITGGCLPDGGLFLPESTVLLEDCSARHAAQYAELGGTAQSKATAPLLAPLQWNLRDARLEFTVDQPFDSYFVLGDQFYPGWVASLDGKEVDILPANYVQRAVFLPSGKHQLNFDYKPDSLSRGRAISLAALALWFVVLLVCAVRGRAKSEP